MPAALLPAAPSAVLAAQKQAAGSPVLVTAALLGIAAVVVLITVLKVHPFLALILGSAVLGVVGGLGVDGTVTSFTKGVGSTVGSVGLLIALGAMIGGLLADSGGADTVVRRTVDRVSTGALPWAFAGVAALIGIPLFFEVGVVLLVPIVLLVARRADLPVLRVGIPALAGLSVLHGFVPPHPGPLVAIDALKADLGLTLGLGLLLAVPAVLLAGPVYGQLCSRWVRPDPGRALALGGGSDFGATGGARGTDLGAPEDADDVGRHPGGGGGTRVPAPAGGGRAGAPATARPATAGPATAGPATVPPARVTAAPVPPRRTPGVAATVATVLLPVVLICCGPSAS